MFMLRKTSRGWRAVGDLRRAVAVLSTLALTALQGAADPAAAAGIAQLPALKPVMTCAAVLKLDLSAAVGAKVTFSEAKVVKDGTTPAYCQVTGTIAPASTVVLRLPIYGWTQRYLQTGCGGLCGYATIGYTQTDGCQPVTNGRFVSATTDMGHQGQSDGSWAKDDPAAQIDFAYRSVHRTALLGKALAAKFYGKAPVYAYFDGCSDGGREALMEAQRYPNDFDGIAAGAPANDFVVQNTFHHTWNVIANQNESGKFILLAGKLQLVHDAVIAACDSLDGVSDGILDDPRKCNFDPSVLRCTSGQDGSTCLTKAEVEVVRKLHDGATTENGLYLEQKISHEWGSELFWTLFVPSKQGQTSFSETIALGVLRYLAYFNTYDTSYALSDLKFTVKNFWKTVETSKYLSATDPDLSAFKKQGGKLILWHGWSDQHISPQGTLEYYDAMQKIMGKSAVESFARLYMFPGMAHCGGGDGPNSFDVLTPLMAWVEGGTAPYRLVATLYDGSGAVSRTRPVYPFPTVARYSGTGSTDTASSFHPYTPSEIGTPNYNWVGTRLYSAGYEARCRVVGTAISCTGGNNWRH